VVEGSIPNEKITAEGYWAGMGTDKRTGQPITLCEWIDRLAPKAWGVVAVGTCATYGGIHAMEGNPTGCMGLADYLGKSFRTKAGLPVVNVPGCPVQPDNFMETLLYLLYHAAGLAPIIPLDEQLRPTWLFGKTVHEGCDRAGYYEQGDFAHEYGSPKCLVKIGCWGSWNNPEVCDYKYENMNEWGKAMYVTPGIIVDGELVTNNLVDINLGIRILLGSSYYQDWQDGGEVFVKKDPLGNPVDKRHPWNQTTTPKPQKRDFRGNYTWVMSPRWYDQRTNQHLALDTGGGPIARLWSTALSGLVDIGVIKATGSSVKIRLPKTMLKPEVEFEWKIPKWSNAIERDRARTYFQAYAAVRGVLSHHVVIRNRKIANYHPYPPTPWNASPRDSYGTPGPYEDAVQNTPIFEENGPDKFKGIDIMRAVRSSDPCLPCGVHMYLGNGKVLEQRHAPMFGVQR
jgi:coenzyme F420-reducing hydrogenase gamma subunit